MRNRCSVLALSLWGSLAFADCNYADPRLYNELLFSSVPSSVSSLMAGENNTIYQGGFTFPGGDTTQLPTQASVESLCAAASATGAPLITLDIESWDTSSSSARAATKTKWETVLGWCRTQITASQEIGAYGEAPIRDYVRAIQTVNSCEDVETCTGAQAYAEWQSHNDQMNFSASADALYPSIYLFYYEQAPYTNTLAYAEAQLDEAERLCPTCTIAPFIWPFFHESGDMAGGITSISTANPAVVDTDDTHNIETGMTVYLTGGDVPASIKNVPLRVTRIDSDEFSLDGVNGSGFSYTSGGSYQATIPNGQWVKLLERIGEHTNKAVLWGGSGITWKSTVPWWETTEKYIECKPATFNYGLSREVRIRRQ